jgi:predicted RNase H-like HicB family nuclease
MTQRYLIVVEKASNNYSAYSPDLPGCIATGKTADETKRNMRIAIEMHLRGLAQDGLPIPVPQAISDYVSVAA